MVGQHPGGRGADRLVEGDRLVDHLAQLAGVPGALQEREVERGVHLAAGAGTARSAAGRRSQTSPSRARGSRVGVGDRAATPGRSRGCRRGRCRGAGRPAGVGVEVGQERVLDQDRGRVDPEAVHAAVEPEPQDAAGSSSRTAGFSQLKSGCSGANRCRYHWPGVPSGSVTRVQAGPPKCETASCSAARRRRARGRAGTRTRSARPSAARAASASWNHGCWSEQWFGTMSRMILMPSSCASAISASTSAERAEGGLDVAVVGDVVAGVGHRRGVAGVEPDRVDAEVGQVAESVADAVQVADPVAVAVGEAAHVDLVGDGVAPPGLGAAARRASAAASERSEASGCRGQGVASPSVAVRDHRTAVRRRARRGLGNRDGVGCRLGNGLGAAAGVSP